MELDYWLLKSMTGVKIFGEINTVKKEREENKSHHRENKWQSREER